MQFDQARLLTHALLNSFALPGPYNMKFMERGRKERGTNLFPKANF